MKKLLLTISIISASVLPTFAFANSIISISADGTIQPNKEATVRVSSSVADLGGADIAWSVDGEPTTEGVGMTSIKVTPGNLGESMHVTAVVTYLGAMYRNDITLTPTIMDVLWEAQTAVPPFFHGKAMPSHMSIVRTLAIPFFSSSTTGDLANFSWKKDRTISLGTGVGNSSVQVLGAWQDASIPLSIEAKNGDLASSQTLRIPSFVPATYFYEISPTQGILTQTALQNRVERDTSELTIDAVPYGVANSERTKSRVQYDWLSNNINILSGFGLNYEHIKLSHTNDPNKSGTIAISFSAQNAVNVMQLAEGNFTWFFNNK